jgi:hypothetical protein
MSLPNKDNLKSLDYVYLGQPFVQAEAKTINTQGLDVAYQSQPFVGAAALVEPNVYANVNGTWKQASKVYVNVNGIWKDVVDDKLFVKVGATWKS